VRVGIRLVVIFLAMISWSFSVMAKEVDVHESFENGLNGWKSLASSKLVRPLPFTNGMLITGGATREFPVAKHLINSEINLEVKAFELDPSFKRLVVSVDYYSDGEIKHTVRHVFEKKSVSILKEISWILDKFSLNTFTIHHKIKKKTVSEIQMSPSMKSLMDKFLEICKSWIETTKPEKYDRAIVRVDIGKTGNSSFTISGTEFHDRMRLDDIYDEHLSAAVKHQIISENESTSGNSHLAKIKYQATSGNKFLVLSSSSEQSAIVTKKFELNKGEEYLVSVDATNITGRTSPQLIVIDQESYKPILTAGLDPDIAQSGWHSFGGSFRATSSQVIFALVSNPNYKYGKYGLDVAFDNLVLSSFRAKKPINKEFEFEVKGQNRYFSPLKLTNTKPAWHKLTAPEIAQIDVPIYNLNFDENKYWNRVDNLFGINANKIKDYGKATALFENDNEKFTAKIRIRGDTAAHLFTPTKSWRVEFEKPKYFHGKRSINLIRPEVRGIVGEKFNFFMAKILGLIALDDTFAFVFMNDTPYGLMYEVEHWSADILEKNRRPEGNIYAENNDYEGATDASVFKKYPIRSGKEWKKYAKDPRVKKKITDDLNLLNNFMNNDLYEEYASLINYEKFISWSVHSALVGSDHQDSFHNVRLYFNPTDGRFEMIPWDHHSRFVYDKQSGLYKFFYPVVGGPIDTNFYIDYFFRDNMAFSERNKRLWASLNNNQLLMSIDNFFKKSYEKIRFELSLTPRYDFNWGKEIKSFELLDKRMRNLPAEYKNYIDQTRSILMKKASGLEYHVAESDVNLEISFVRDDSAGELVSTRIEIEGIDTSGFDLAAATIRFYDRNSGLVDEHPIKLSLDDNILSFEYPSKSYSQRYLEILPYVLNPDVLNFVKQRAGNDQKLISMLKEAYALNPSDANQYHLTGKTTPSQKEQLVDFFKDLSIIQSIPSELAISVPKKLNRQQEESLKALNVLAYNSVTKELVDLSQADSHFLSESIESHPQSLKDTKLEHYKTLHTIKASNRLAILEKLGNNRKNESSFSSYYKFFRAMPAVLENYPFILEHPSIEGALLIPAGEHVIRENVIIPPGLEIHIEPGAALYLGEKVSFVSKSRVIAAATESAPITITRLIQNKPWGAFVVLHEKASGFFSNVNFIGGSDLYLNGTYFSGMLSAHFSDVVVQNCLFHSASEGGGDDAINVKNAAATISDSSFSMNFGDAIDFDFVEHGSKISRSKFLNTGNDGIDISGSDMVIVENNEITASGDKGVSIGEDSRVLLNGNIIKKNKIGVVAKDSSTVEIVKSIVSENQIGIAVYNKKIIFGGGKVIGSLSTVENNRWNFGVEKIEDATESRQLHDQRKSAILGFASQSEMSYKEFIFPTTEPKLLIKSKKKLLKAAVTGKLKDYDYTYTRFIDYAE